MEKTISYPSEAARLAILYAAGTAVSIPEAAQRKVQQMFGLRLDLDELRFAALEAVNEATRGLVRKGAGRE
jgi:hypothetical protein